MPRVRRLAVPAALVAAIAIAVGAGARERGSEAAPAHPAGARAPTPTYFADVKPILDGRCAGCHHVGGIAPFALTSYGAARLHRTEVAAAVAARIMPPWHAARGVQRYRHDPSLTRSQIDAIVHWAKTGGRRGNRAQA